VEKDAIVVRTWRRTLPVLVFAAIASACSPIVEFQAKPVTYPATIVFNLNVLLRISQELLNTQWKTGSGQEIIVPIGQALSQNSETLARALFSQVQVSKDESISTGSAADAVLVPRVISITHTRPLFIWQEQSTTMVLDWTMKEPSGEVIWADTITVREKATMGGMVSAKDNSRAHVEAVVAQVFQRSFDSISSSPQIRAVAQARGTSR
jgi:hypothetical protein